LKIEPIQQKPSIAGVPLLDDPSRRARHGGSRVSAQEHRRRGRAALLAPVLDEIAREQQGHAIVAKVNIDEHPALAARFNIRSIPTRPYFSGGDLRDQTVGVVKWHGYYKFSTSEFGYGTQKIIPA
jgi:hypothetical protein